MAKTYPSLILFLLAALVPCSAQQSAPKQGSYRPVLARSIDGEMSVDGTRMPVNTDIFYQDEVTSDDTAHLKIINQGNTISFTPKSKFTALKNAYKLNDGGSKVATKTGMIAYLPNCYSVMPVDPLLVTLYEVDWSGSSVWVYARSHDVRIAYWRDGNTRHPWETEHPRGADQGWIVKEGTVARVREVHLCQPLLDFWPDGNLDPAIEMMGATAVATSEPFWWSHGQQPEQNLSADQP